MTRGCDQILAMEALIPIPVSDQPEGQYLLRFPRSGAKPFLKWAGGKTRLLPALRRCIPQYPFGTYFEPFVGGGALFFDLQPTRAVLADANPELITCYTVVRDSHEQLIRELSRYRVSESEFYRLRELQPEDLSPVARAAPFDRTRRSA